MNFFTSFKHLIIPIFIFGFISSSIAQDVGVISVIEPLDGSVLILGKDTTVTVRIQNFGTSPVSNIPVMFAIGANGQLTDTYTGTIAGGATADFTLATLYSITSDLSGIGFATTNLGNDIDATNNQISVNYTFASTGLVDDNAQYSAIQIYPSPVVNELMITLKDNNMASINIYSYEGKIVHSFEDCTGRNELKYNVSDLAKGMYMVEFLSKNGKTIKHFVK